MKTSSMLLIIIVFTLFILPMALNEFYISSLLIFTLGVLSLGYASNHPIITKWVDKFI
ncbi:MAG: hypothetical protein U9N30_04330 [Campylobacterota bacterium]|nr:hypothetical protein [Campylobacterota bacterium]